MYRPGIEIVSNVGDPYVEEYGETLYQPDGSGFDHLPPDLITRPAVDHLPAGPGVDDLRSGGYDDYGY